jgi:uncharacterized cupin superfamily protein
MVDDVTARMIEDIAPYQGPSTIPGIKFRPAGRDLGVTAWGMNVLSIDGECTGYPEHDHAKDGQEEVYAVLDGDGWIEADGKRTALGRGSLLRVGPMVRRKILPGPRGIVVLAIGGTPGVAYPAR